MNEYYGYYVDLRNQQMNEITVSCIRDSINSNSRKQKRSILTNIK